MFKCLTTCSISAHVMQDYSASSVIQALTRFGALCGYPPLLLIDRGTQLVTAAQNATINIQDLSGQLNTKFQVGLKHRTSPSQAHNFQTGGEGYPGDQDVVGQGVPGNKVRLAVLGNKLSLDH